MVKEMKKDKLTCRIYETREKMGCAAAEDVRERILKLLTEKEEINMIFAAAPSQNEVLRALCEYSDIDWSRINAFHMDEYIGLNENAPQRFGNFLKNAIFDKVPFKNVFLINCAAEAGEECERYSQLLKAYPCDIVVLGIGENGHIAFNDPGVAKFDDDVLVKVATLDNVCRQQQVNDGCFPKIEDVPKTALTLTIPALTSAKYMYCVVPGETKRDAVRRTMQEAISEDCPASVLRLHEKAVLYCDRDSGADLI